MIDSPKLLLEKGPTRIANWFERLPILQATFLTGILTWFVSTVFYSPPFWLPLAGGAETLSRVDDFNALCANPFQRNLQEPILAYRVTTPLLAWTLGLRGFSGVILQYLAIPAFLSIAFIAMSRRTNRIVAFWSCIAIASTFTVTWTNTMPGFPDSITHLCIAILLLSGHPVLVILLTVLGMLNDERFVLAIPFILLWHANCERINVIFRSSWKLMAGFCIGLLFVLIIRKGLADGWIGPGIERPQVYDGMAKLADRPMNWPHDGWLQYLLNVIMSNRLMWIIPILVIFQLNRKSPLFLTIFISSWLLTLIASGMVADVSRSIGFAYPAILISIVIWTQKNKFQSRTFIALTVACILLPSFYIQNYNGTLDVQLFRPLIFSLIRTWSGWDVLEVLY